MRKQTYQSSEIIPNLGDERVQADGARVRIQGISVLINLVVQHADRAPECGIPPITVHGLLVCLVCLRVLLLRHVASAEKVPALGITVICRGC